MLYLAIIYHMHQPYYKDLLTGEVHMPWVRLHGLKDYLDMVTELERFPDIRLTFNMVPSLVEQIEDCVTRSGRDKYLELSYKPVAELTREDKQFILGRFFSINTDKVISYHPRYLELYYKKLDGKQFNNQDYLDLQVWFNLSWIDPDIRQERPKLREVVNKGRFFSEEDKHESLDEQLQILEEILPAYRKFQSSGQIEITTSPYYHPILPLLYSTNTAKEAYVKTTLPKVKFAYPQDVREQINSAVACYKRVFGVHPRGMWPSEESVSEHILPYIMESGINWIVTDEALLFKSLKLKKRDPRLVYQPHLLERKDAGGLNIVFRDRNLSDLLGFVYYNWNAKDAVADFLKHMENIHNAYKRQNALVVLAMDGENAWEYYVNDGHDFLNEFYSRLSEAKFIKTTTVSDYLSAYPARSQLKRLAAGSWIYADFGKWIGNPYKVKAWEWLAEAREELEKYLEESGGANNEKIQLARKQMHICEGSDWFWWYGEDPEGNFDRLFRLHLSNFYAIIGREPPAYLKEPLRI